MKRLLISLAEEDYLKNETQQEEKRKKRAEKAAKVLEEDLE